MVYFEKNKWAKCEKKSVDRPFKTVYNSIKIRKSTVLL